MHSGESTYSPTQTARSVVRRRAFLTQGQEAFLEGHVYGFERLGGVPCGKVRYDNLNSAVKQVLFGRSRQENERWIAFKSHFLLTELRHAFFQVRR
jgi:hypothetical protein